MTAPKNTFEEFQKVLNAKPIPRPELTKPDPEESEENSKDYVKMAFSKKNNYLLVPPEW